MKGGEPVNYPITQKLKVVMSKMGANYHKQSVVFNKTPELDNVFWNAASFTPEKTYETIAIDLYRYDDGGTSLCYLIINDEGTLLFTSTKNWDVVK